MEPDPAQEAALNGDACLHLTSPLRRQGPLGLWHI
jgi:hypothetical protein